MAEIIKNYNISVTTGHVHSNLQTQIKGVPQTNGEGFTFDEILKNSLLNNKQTMSFSKHAQERIAERNIEMTDEKVEKLNQGMIMAKQRGLGDALILVDQTAFIVNAKNNTVITTMNENDCKGNVFTNIQGTVIL